ncbi:MAG: hypothetical protein V1754_05935 [Pseudomonadota bacterium]
MRNVGLMFASVLVVATLACSDDTKEIGTEGGACYPNGTCNEGLTCASGLCVNVPKEDAGIPDTLKPDTVNPDTVNPDSVGPDTVSPDMEVSDVALKDQLPIDAVATDVAVIEAAAQDITEQDIGQDITEQDIGQDITEQDIGQDITEQDIGQDTTAQDIGQDTVAHPLCIAAGGTCTAARWNYCPAGTEPVDPDPHKDCGDGTDNSGWCCVSVSIMMDCTTEPNMHCMVGTSCPTAAGCYQSCCGLVSTKTCQAGRVCCEDICGF